MAVSSLSVSGKEVTNMPLLLAFTVAASALDCSGRESCAGCTAAGCSWIETTMSCTEPSGALVETMDCCAADPNHAAGASWMCDDRCNTCTCTADGSIKAAGCIIDLPAPEQPPSLFSEEYLVSGAMFVVLTCFLAFGVVCYIMCCCKRKPQALPTKELDKNEEDEQLAAGD